MNPEIEDILEATLEVGPATVLTNGLILTLHAATVCGKSPTLREYSLDFRVSLDGYDATSNDPIRGEGTFERILDGLSTSSAAGLNPVLTVTEVRSENASPAGRSASSSCCVTWAFTNRD